MFLIDPMLHVMPFQARAAIRRCFEFSSMSMSIYTAKHFLENVYRLNFFNLSLTSPNDCLMSILTLAEMM